MRCLPLRLRCWLLKSTVEWAWTWRWIGVGFAERPAAVVVVAGPVGRVVLAGPDGPAELGPFADAVVGAEGFVAGLRWFRYGELWLF